MTFELIPMTAVHYEKFTSHSINHFANQKVKAGTWLQEDALNKSKETYEHLLPQGLNTNLHYLLSIVNEGQTIGWLWYFFDDSKLQKEAFIYDFYIYEEHQGRGFGKSSLSALDMLARDKGIKKISLHVFAHNKRAKQLYEKMGFEATDISMSKVLETTIL
ncbi:GNAT family N-acetyltransferase [Chengkuizengella sediminis]|uniref:GNAT family N-acetyltransferase n=1 Tax=Chengkuizengella sediminis TaxID=1885917 RepID=UPI00138A4CC2|nr:GNAT family N-acetyltransferase [Chengkuizengella sediminis]NDI34108.1 GNAT family N-acetyltransferase [Chengkuizengella sediminis]